MQFMKSSFHNLQDGAFIDNFHVSLLGLTTRYLSLRNYTNHKLVHREQFEHILYFVLKLNQQ